MTDERIPVEVPMSDTRRERVEREVFARLDAMRDVDRANNITPQRSRRMPMLAAGFVFVAAAASVLLLATRETPSAPPSTPSLVVTPAGGSSRFTVGDSVIDAGSDTSVEVKHEANGGTTLVLARGSVDCDVMPRPDRPPFRVLAGDVTVEVVGTRFAVSRVNAGSNSITRVDVTRGKVKVHGNGEQRFISAGESWSSAGSTVTAMVPQPTVEPIVTDEQPPPPVADELVEIELPAETARRPQITPSAAFAAAVQLQKTDPKQAMKAFRKIANGNHAWAAVALYSLAELQSRSRAGASGAEDRSNVDATLGSLDELEKRFPKAVNAEDAAWLRVEVLRDARRMDDAHAAAAKYLHDFPQGTYAKLAARLVP